MINQPPTPPPGQVPPDSNQRLRALTHELSNALETIMQAAYLLAQANLSAPHGRWAEMIEKAGQDAADVTRELRSLLRDSGER